jgi:hypothetical protein
LSELRVLIDEGLVRGVPPVMPSNRVIPVKLLLGDGDCVSVGVTEGVVVTEEVSVCEAVPVALDVWLMLGVGVEEAVTVPEGV